MWACLPFIYLLNSFLPSSYFWKVNILAVWGKFKILLQLCFFQWGNTIHSFPPADDWVNKIAHHHDIFWHDTQLIAIDNDMNELEPPEKLNYDRMRGNWRDYSGTSVGTNQNNNWTITRQKAIYWSELWHGKTLGGDSSTEHWIKPGSCFILLTKCFSVFRIKMLYKTPLNIDKGIKCLVYVSATEVEKFLPHFEKTDIRLYKPPWHLHILRSHFSILSGFLWPRGSVSPI